MTKKREIGENNSGKKQGKAFWKNRGKNMPYSNKNTRHADTWEAYLQSRGKGSLFSSLCGLTLGKSYDKIGD